MPWFSACITLLRVDMETTRWTGVTLQRYTMTASNEIISHTFTLAVYKNLPAYIIIIYTALHIRHVLYIIGVHTVLCTVPFHMVPPTCLSQGKMQDSWKRCLHGNFLSLSSTLNASLHTVQPSTSESRQQCIVHVHVH